MAAWRYEIFLGVDIYHDGAKWKSQIFNKTREETLYLQAAMQRSVISTSMKYSGMKVV